MWCRGGIAHLSMPLIVDVMSNQCQVSRPAFLFQQLDIFFVLAFLNVRKKCVSIIFQFATCLVGKSTSLPNARAAGLVPMLV